MKRPKILKILRKVVIIFTSIILALMLAIHILFNTSLGPKLVNAILSENVDGTVDFSRIHVSVLKSFPSLRVTVDTLSLTYPHEQYARFDTLGVDNYLLKQGRGPVSDTLVAFDQLSASVNLWRLISGRVRVNDAHVNSIRAYLHVYDENTSNLSMFKSSAEEEPEDSTETSSSLPWLSFGPIDIAEDPHLVYTNQADTLFGRVDFRRLRVEGRLKIKPGNMKIRDLHVELDTLKFCGRMPSDTVGFSLDSLVIREPDKHIFDIQLGAVGVMLAEGLGTIRVPVGLDGRVGFNQEDGQTSIDIPSLTANIAYMPLEFKGKVDLLPGIVKMNARLAINNADIGKIWSQYGYLMVPAYADKVSTDAHLNLKVDAQGEYTDHTWPLVKASFSIPKCNFAYKPVGLAGTLAIAADAVSTSGKVVSANVPVLVLDVPGLRFNGNAAACDLVGGNPDLAVCAKANASFARLCSYLPSLGISGNGDLDLNIQAAARLNDIEKLTADLNARISSKSLDLNVPGGMNVRAGDLLVELSDTKASSALEGRANAGRLQLRSGDELAVRIKNMRNDLRMVSTSPDDITNVHQLKVEDNTERIFINAGSNRIGLKSLSLDVAAARRPQKVGSGSFRPKIRRNLPDSLRRKSYRRPDYLSEKDFRSSDIKFNLEGGARDLLDEWKPYAQISAEGGRFISPALPLRTRLGHVDMIYNDDKFDLNSLNATMGSSDFSLDGSVWGLKKFVRGRGRIGIKLDMESNHINANELLAAFQQGNAANGNMESGGETDADEDAYERRIVVDTLSNAAKPDSMKLIVLPANVDANLKLLVNRLDYSNLDARQFVAQAALRERTLQVLNTSVKTDLGNVNLDAYYSTRTKKDISAGVDIHMRNLTADKIIDILPQADSLMPMLRSFEGLMSMDVAATTKLDTCMNVLMPSIDGVVRIKGQDMHISDAGDLKKITRLLMFRDKNIGDLGDLSVDAVIHNNKLEVFPFIFQADRYTLALNGQQKLDNNFDYYVSVLKWPLLLRFGINLHGNFDKWRFRLHRPLWKNGVVPNFDEELGQMQKSIDNSIRNIYRYGSGGAMQRNANYHSMLEKKRVGEYQKGGRFETLSMKDERQINSMVIESDIKEEQDKLQKELDQTLSDIERDAKLLEEKYKDILN